MNTLSIVIRVRNEAPALKIVMEALTSQVCTYDWELIVVDNESDDNTLQIARQFNAKIINIPKDDFSYGGALNLGINHSSGKFILLLSAHSLPIGSNFLNNLLIPFEDKLVAAARCTAVNNWNELLDWYKPMTIQYKTMEEQNKAELGDHWIKMYPSASCCVLRRSVWDIQKFDESIEFGEDKFWTSDILAKGFKIARNSEAFFWYMKEWKRIDIFRRNNKQYQVMYRKNNYTPLSVSHFVVRILKAFIMAPFIGLKFFVEQVVKNYLLVIVPYQVPKIKRIGFNNWRNIFPFPYPDNCGDLQDLQNDNLKEDDKDWSNC